MMQFLEFTFQDLTHFVGICILLSIAVGAITGIAAIIFRRK